MSTVTTLFSFAALEEPQHHHHQQPPRLFWSHHVAADEEQKHDPDSSSSITLIWQANVVGLSVFMTSNATGTAHDLYFQDDSWGVYSALGRVRATVSPQTLLSELAPTQQTVGVFLDEQGGYQVLTKCGFPPNKLAQQQQPSDFYRRAVDEALQQCSTMDRGRAFNFFFPAAQLNRVPAAVLAKQQFQISTVSTPHSSPPPPTASSASSTTKVPWRVCGVFQYQPHHPVVFLVMQPATQLLLVLTLPALLSVIDGYQSLVAFLQTTLQQLDVTRAAARSHGAARLTDVPKGIVCGWWSEPEQLVKTYGMLVSKPYHHMTCPDVQQWLDSVITAQTSLSAFVAGASSLSRAAEI